MRANTGVSDDRKAPWTFRPDPDIEELAESARVALGWSRTKILNEALKTAVPLLLAGQRAKLDRLNPGGLAVEDIASRSGAAAMAAAGVPVPQPRPIAASPSDNTPGPSSSVPPARARRRLPPDGAPVSRESQSAA